MRARALRSLIALSTLALLACGSPEVERAEEVVVTVRSASELTPLPAIAPELLGVGARVLGEHRFVVAREALLDALEVEGFCPAPIARLTTGPVIDVSLTPVIEPLVPPPVGFEAPFTVEVRPGCRTALAGNITWEVLSAEGGAPADVSLRGERRGFVVHGHTLARVPSDPARPAWGLVPISARQTGAIVLRLRHAREGRTITREVRVLAAARSTGLPSIPIGVGVYLRGGPFELRESPPGALAALEPADASGLPGASLQRLVPDVAGRWVIADASGRELALRSGEHASTPLDCGRSSCHAAETEHAASSPMAAALHGHLAEPCALACHATGEPGVPDGGFAHVAGRVGWRMPSSPPADPLAAMPRALRRLAGVGCTACHGPGAIPEASARWAILRADVCATCHDAPPRYGHVLAWSRSAMSASDLRPETREPPCARCHTTAGFLASIDARHETAVPLEAGALGIACAACHAPHAEARLERALVRRLDIPEALGALPPAWNDTPATVCLRCHAPLEGDVSATSAAILVGVGGVDEEGDALPASDEDAPHRDVLCTECHGAAPDASGLDGSTVERGASHAFAIDRERCLRCHERAALDTLFASREVLWAAATARAAGLGLDTSGAHVAPGESASTRNLALVLGDRGAWAHAPRYAARLLGVGTP